MDDILQMLQLRWEHLLGRAAGPLNFRFLMMPTVVTILAIRAGLRDARETQPGFLWMLLTRGSQRKALLRSALKDIGRVLIVAMVMDTVYQVIVFKSFYLGEALIVAFVSAVVPYVLFRGPISVLTRFLSGRRTDDLGKG
jgi:hypothetical protein